MATLAVNSLMSGAIMTCDMLALVKEGLDVYGATGASLSGTIDWQDKDKVLTVRETTEEGLTAERWAPIK